MRLLWVFVGCAWSLLWVYSGSILGVRLKQENAKLTCFFLTACKSVLCIFKIGMWRHLIICQSRFKRSVSEIGVCFLYQLWVSLRSACIQAWVPPADPKQTLRRHRKQTRGLVVSDCLLVGWVWSTVYTYIT